VLDTFHMYRGGSMYEGVKLLRGVAFAVCHFNDVPASPPQFELSDSDRIMPGDGILPLVPLVRDLLAGGFRGPFSLEIFNKGYWERDPMETAREGLAKTRAVIDAARQA
jgi:sugar phosphate isomerase/epimerase